MPWVFLKSGMKRAGYLVVLGVAVGSFVSAPVGCASPRAASSTIVGKPNEETRFVMSANQPWNDTGRRICAGHTYRLSAQVEADEEYKDQFIPCTPDGPASMLGRTLTSTVRDATFPLHPGRLLGPGKIKRLRVLRDRTGRYASFLTLIAAIGRDDREENVYVIGRGRTFSAHTNGELIVFSNDWPGGPGATGDRRFANSKSYGNNHGHLVVTIEEL